MSRAAAVRIDGQTRLMGVLGHQIQFTLSPTIHNYAAVQLGQNIAYVPFDVEEKHIDTFLDLMWNIGCLGFSVTTPHKARVAARVKTDLASVNTVFRGKSGWEGASTDGVGFAKGLARIGRTLESFSAVIFLGGGGVVCGLLEYFDQISFKPEIKIVRRSGASDQDLKAAAGSLAISCHDLTLANLQNILHGRGSDTLFIQATSAPLHGDDLEALTPALDSFTGITVDLIYSQPSKLYFYALSKDQIALDGEAMLIEQARAAQMLWWQRTVPYEDIVQVLRGRK